MTVDDAGAGPSAALRTTVASGVRWGFIVSIATQVSRIVFMVALMRLLGPRNFGIVGQAAVIIAVAQIFVHFGLAASIVQRPQLDHERDRHRVLAQRGDGLAARCLNGARRTPISLRSSRQRSSQRSLLSCRSPSS